MRILHIVGAWAPDYGGGATETTREIALRQTRRGHDVFVLAGRFNLTPWNIVREEDQGIRVLRFGVGDEFREDPEGWWLPERIAREQESRVAGLVERVIEQARPDVVDYHVNRPLGEEALFALARCGIPVVASLHDFWLLCGRVMLLHEPWGVECAGPARLKCALCVRSRPGAQRLRLQTEALARLVLRHPRPFRKLRRRREAASTVRAAMARSEYVARRHRGLFPNCEATLRGIAHDGVQRRFSRSPGPVRFGFFSGDEPGKGLDLVSRAAGALWNENREFEVHVFGRVSTPQDPRLILRGAFNSSDREAAFRTIDVAVMATRFAEPRGRIPEEAALFGVPAIVPDVGGLPETIRDGATGFLYPREDVQALSDCLQRFLSEDLLRRISSQVELPPNLMEAVPAVDAIYAAARVNGPESRSGYPPRSPVNERQRHPGSGTPDENR